MSLAATLENIKRESRATWSPGQNLARLRLVPADEARLRTALRERLLRGHFDYITGAALMLAGARVFHEVGVAAYIYDTIGVALSVPGLGNRLGGQERDAMERGLRQIFSVPVTWSGGQRRFVTTMLLHSGGGWGILYDLCPALLRRWSWQGFLTASDELAADLIESLGQATGGRTAKLTTTEEARLAVVEMLRAVGRACLAIEERGWLASSWDETLAAMRREGETPNSRLPMLTDGEASGILQRALALGAEAADERRFDWRWESRTARGLLPRLVLRVPRVLSPLDVRGLPAGTERIRLYVAGGEEVRDRIVYTRSGDELRLQGAVDVLPLPRLVGRVAAVMAEYRAASGLGEIAVQSVELPWDPVAIFDVESGRPVSSPPAGRPVVLVIAADTTLVGLPAGFAPNDAVPAGLRAYVGPAPCEPVAVTGFAAGAPFEHWIGPRGKGPAIELPPSPWPDLAHQGARCYREWPAPRVDAPAAVVTLTGPLGAVPVRMRWGRVEPGGPTPAGVYRIESHVGARGARMQFTLLPEGAFEAASATGETALRARVGGRPCKLLLVDGEDTGEGELRLGRDVSGPVDVTVLVPIPGRPLSLSWRPRAMPRRAEIVSRSDGEPTDDRDLSLLRGQGGIRIRGPGRLSFSLTAGDVRRSWCLTAEGERFFPFSALSALELRDGRSVEIKIRWADGLTQSLGRFHDPTARRPPIEVTEDKLRIEVGRLVPGEPIVEMVRAWEPWLPPVRVPATVVHVPGSAAPRVEVPLPTPPAPTQVIVMVGDQRLSGMALVHGKAEVDPTLDPLRASLWAGPLHKEKLAERLDDVDGAEVLRGLLRCYRRYGSQWFQSSDRVADVVSWRGIPALLDGGGDDDLRDLLATLFASLRRPAELAIRYADFQRVPPPATGEAWVRALRTLAEVRTGLLLAAWNAWGPVHPDVLGEVMPLLGTMHEADVWLLPLSADERELLRQPPEEVPSGVRPRVRGLIEIRKQLIHLQEESDAGGLSPADACVQSWLRKTEEAGVPRAILQGGLPEPVAMAEAAVVRVARTVDAWRRARPFDYEPVVWADVRIFWERFPATLDFWLNRLFIHSQPLDPNPSVRAPTPHALESGRKQR